MENPQRKEPSLPNEDRKQTSRKFKGIRQREWGRWLAEIRMPKSREKIYLGSYKTAEQAARAFDAAMYCVRGPNAKFNFPDSVPAIPSTSSLSRQQIQVAATKYALNELPFAAPSLDHNTDNNSKEEPSQSSSVSEMALSSDEREISEEMAFWKSLFSRSEGAECLNLEKIPSIDEALALELALTSQEEEIDISVDPTALWNFENVPGIFGLDLTDTPDTQIDRAYVPQIPEYSKNLQ